MLVQGILRSNGSAVKRGVRSCCRILQQLAIKHLGEDDARPRTAQDSTPKVLDQPRPLGRTARHLPGPIRRGSNPQLGRKQHQRPIATRYVKLAGGGDAFLQHGENVRPTQPLLSNPAAFGKRVARLDVGNLPRSNRLQAD